MSFDVQFKFPAGVLAGVSSFGANRPTHAVAALAKVIGLRNMYDKQKQLVPGAFIIDLKYPDEHGGFEDNITINDPNRAGQSEDGQRLDRVGLRTVLEALGYGDEVFTDAYSIEPVWFAPVNGVPREMSVVFRPGITGVKDSYGRSFAIARKKFNDAMAKNVDPATMVPPASAPGGDVNKGTGAPTTSAAAAAPTPSIGTAAPTSSAPVPANGGGPPMTTSAAPATGQAPPAGMAAFVQ